jgi:hypothetical protein
LRGPRVRGCFPNPVSERARRRPAPGTRIPRRRSRQHRSAHTYWSPAPRPVRARLLAPSRPFARPPLDQGIYAQRSRPNSAVSKPPPRLSLSQRASPAVRPRHWRPPRHRSRARASNSPPDRPPCPLVRAYIRSVPYHFSTLLAVRFVSGKRRHRPPLFCRCGSSSPGHLTVSPLPCAGPRESPRLRGALGPASLYPERRRAGDTPLPRSPFGELPRRHLLVPFSLSRHTPNIAPVVQVHPEQLPSFSSTAVTAPPSSTVSPASLRPPLCLVRPGAPHLSGRTRGSS